MTNDRRDDAERLAEALVKEFCDTFYVSPTFNADALIARIAGNIRTRDATIAAKDAEIAHWREQYDALIENFDHSIEVKVDERTESMDIEIAALKDKLVAAECVLEDEEAGALESVDLIQRQRAEITALRAENERLKAAVSDISDVCDLGHL